MSTDTNATLKKGVTFAKEVLARLTGDDQEAKAQKIARKAITAVQSKVASLNAQEVDAETRVEDAQEAFNNAKYPTDIITEAKAYVEGIAQAHQNLKGAEKELANIRKNQTFFNELLSSF